MAATAKTTATVTAEMDCFIVFPPPDNHLPAPVRNCRQDCRAALARPGAESARAFLPEYYLDSLYQDGEIE